MIKEFVNPASVLAKAFQNSFHWTTEKDYLKKDPVIVSGTNSGKIIHHYDRNGVEASIYLVRMDDSVYPMGKKFKAEAIAMMLGLGNNVHYADSIFVGTYKYAGKTVLKNLCLTHENIEFFNAVEILSGQYSPTNSALIPYTFHSVMNSFGRLFGLRSSEQYTRHGSFVSFSLRISDTFPSMVEFCISDGIKQTPIASIDFVENASTQSELRASLIELLHTKMTVPSMFIDMLELMINRHWWLSGYAASKVSRGNVFAGYQSIEFAVDSDNMIIRLVGIPHKTGMGGFLFHTVIPYTLTEFEEA